MPSSVTKSYSGGALITSATKLVAGLLILRSLFRAGHFDLDVYPSQSVLQGSITILLAGVYLSTIWPIAIPSRAAPGT